jgi:hypothetical protein
MVLKESGGTNFRSLNCALCGSNEDILAGNVKCVSETTWERDVSPYDKDTRKMPYNEFYDPKLWKIPLCPLCIIKYYNQHLVKRKRGGKEAIIASIIGVLLGGFGVLIGRWASGELFKYKFSSSHMIIEHGISKTMTIYRKNPAIADGLIYLFIMALLAVGFLCVIILPICIGSYILNLYRLKRFKQSNKVPNFLKKHVYYEAGCQILSILEGKNKGQLWGDFTLPMLPVTPNKKKYDNYKMKKQIRIIEYKKPKR